MLADILVYLGGAPLWLVCATLFVAAALEYIVPPLPGDTFTLFGAFIAFQLGMGGLVIFVAITAGAICGSLAAYSLGRWLSERPQALPAWAQRPAVRVGLDRVKRGFERKGAALLLFNRFVPAMRAFFFVGAGLARMRVAHVALFGGLSVLAWNALLLGVAALLGGDWATLLAFTEQYSVAALSLLTAGAAIWWARRRWHRRGAARRGE